MEKNTPFVNKSLSLASKIESWFVLDSIFIQEMVTFQFSNLD